MRLRWEAVAAVAAVSCILFVLIVVPSLWPAQFASAFNSCVVDDDCTTKSFACGIVSINRNYDVLWNLFLKPNQVCPAVLGCFYTKPECLSGRCEMECMPWMEVEKCRQECSVRCTIAGDVDGFEWTDIQGVEGNCSFMESYGKSCVCVQSGG